MRVADASVCFKWFAREPDSELALRLLRSGETLIAPDLVVPECVHVGRRRVAEGAFSEAALTRLLRNLPHALEEFVPTVHLAADAARLARETKHRETYDCFYLALAVRRDAPVVTADRKLIRNARRAGYGDFVVHLADAVGKE